MGDAVWPPVLKPLTNKNYSLKRGGGIVAIPVDGGVPRTGRNLSIEAVPFNLNFILSDLGARRFNYFLDWEIDGGADSFKMNLDAGNGIEVMQVTIVENSISLVKPSDGNWYLAFSVNAESISSQLEQDCPNFYQLYDCYGDQLPRVLCSLDSLIVNMENKLEYP